MELKTIQWFRLFEHLIFQISLHRNGIVGTNFVHMAVLDVHLSDSPLKLMAWLWRKRLLLSIMNFSSVWSGISDETFSSRNSIASYLYSGCIVLYRLTTLNDTIILSLRRCEVGSTFLSHLEQSLVHVLELVSNGYLENYFVCVLHKNDLIL